MMAIVLMILWMPVAAGCSLFAKAPMDVLTYQADETPPNRNLIVFLRGIGGSHRSFESEGLVADIRERGLPYDMVAPNAHLGYYSGRTLIERLREDVILPARAQGYEQIWLVGFSMGGLGSLLYIREQPQDIQGVCLIAPFLGYKKILREIEAAGGVRDWTPGEYDPVDDWERMLWHWVQGEVRSGGFDPPVYLFFGDQDSYVEGQQLLATVLPPERVGTLEGQHDIATFKNLWRQFLERRLAAARVPKNSLSAAALGSPN
jgi:pimeloyl-ACP methyl ester carboxylesterase